jgi:hypothetical protein
LASSRRSSKRRCARSRGRRVGQWRAREQTHQWFFDDDRQWPFAFRNVCVLLGLDAEALRGWVLGELKQRREARPRSIPPTRPPKER